MNVKLCKKNEHRCLFHLSSGDGQLSLLELEMGLASIGMMLSSDDLRCMFEAAGVDEDGEITLASFKKMVCR